MSDAKTNYYNEISDTLLNYLPSSIFDENSPDCGYIDADMVGEEQMLRLAALREKYIADGEYNHDNRFKLLTLVDTTVNETGEKREEAKDAIVELLKTDLIAYHKSRIEEDLNFMYPDAARDFDERCQEMHWASN